MKLTALLLLAALGLVAVCEQADAARRVKVVVRANGTTVVRVR